MSEPGEGPVVKDKGRWAKGKSGNPAGRPLSNKQKILDRKHTLEEYIRGKIDKDKLVAVVTKLVDQAATGDTKSAKILLPFILSKAGEGTEDGADRDRGGIVFRIENATIKPQRPVIAVEAEVIS
jgi:hypothetical protein